MPSLEGKEKERGKTVKKEETGWRAGGYKQALLVLMHLGVGSHWPWKDTLGCGHSIQDSDPPLSCRIFLSNSVPWLNRLKKKKPKHTDGIYLPYQFPPSFASLSFSFWMLNLGSVLPRSQWESRTIVRWEHGLTGSDVFQWQGSLIQILREVFKISELPSFGNICLSSVSAPQCWRHPTNSSLNSHCLLPLRGCSHTQPTFSWHFD